VPATSKHPPTLPDHLLPDLSELPAWTSPQQLADWFDVPVKSVYRWNASGTGPRPTKIGKHIRYSRQSVADFLASREQNSTEPLGA
jgi:predicted DNA-binding transcriptional regulator AlpA